MIEDIRRLGAGKAGEARIGSRTSLDVDASGPTVQSPPYEPDEPIYADLRYFPVFGFRDSIVFVRPHGPRVSAVRTRARCDRIEETWPPSSRRQPPKTLRCVGPTRETAAVNLPGSPAASAITGVRLNAVKPDAIRSGSVDDAASCVVEF